MDEWIFYNTITGFWMVDPSDDEDEDSEEEMEMWEPVEKESEEEPPRILIYPTSHF